MRDDFLNQNLTPEAQKTLKEKGLDPSLLKSNNAEKLLSSLSKEDANKITNILNDKEALKNLLSKDSTKAIINKLFGGDK